MFDGYTYWYPASPNRLLKLTTNRSIANDRPRESKRWTQPPEQPTKPVYFRGLRQLLDPKSLRTNLNTIDIHLEINHPTVMSLSNQSIGV